MSKRRLRSWNSPVRAGVGFARALEAAPRLRWNGCAARANGRTCFRRIGAASLTNGSPAAFASSGLRKGGAGRAGGVRFAELAEGGPQRLERRPHLARQPVHLAERRGGLVERAGQLRDQ